MGSNPYAFIDEDLPCPVCKRTLSTPGAHAKVIVKKGPKKRSKGRPQYLLTNNLGRADVQYSSLGKPSKDDEEIVVAQCGHLFHKFCLRHYCYLYREGQANPMCRVSCPLCKRNISMMSSQGIEYKVHQDRITHREKEYTQTSVMHSELSGQLDNASKKLGRMYEQVEEGGHNLEMFRSHWRKIKGDMKQSKQVKQKSESLKSELERTDKMLSFMQAQHLKIVKKFITKVKHKSPKDYIHFPRRLAPYLSVIEVDDRMVRDLGEIIVPIHLNNLKSDRQSLLKGILTSATEQVKAQQPVKSVRRQRHPVKKSKTPRARKISPPTPPRQPQKQKVPPPRVIVKVRKSSVSILSSTVLTKESVQHILQNVKNVPEKAKRNVCIEDPEGQKDVRVEETVLNDFSSSSDVKILFMPKRQALQQYSEPCRSIEGSDSFQVKVPTRRCKSTDAVIVKTRKNAKDSFRSRESRHKSKLTLEHKRSSSIPDISKTKERIEKMEILVLDTKPPETARRASKGGEPDIIPDIPEEYQPSTSLNPTKVDVLKGERDDLNNNLLLENLPPEPISVPGSAQQNLIAGHCEIEKPATVTTPVTRTSLLEMIYDELEEEKNFQTTGSKCWVGTVDEDTNGNSLQLPARTEDDPDWSYQSPQFFRVDKRGVLHPEDPCHVNFRQPTFLYPMSNIKERPDSQVGYEESDEENQLRTLPTEERILIAAEKEAALSEMKTNFGSVRAKRPIFHGLPACMGMPDAQYPSEGTRIPNNTPDYLKKWQRQFTSRRITTTDISAIPTIPPVSASRLQGQTGQQRMMLMSTPGPQNIFRQQQYSQKVKEESHRSFLPPLSTFPTKRPSTADCAKITEWGDYYNRFGKEMTLDGNYDDYFP